MAFGQNKNDQRWSRTNSEILFWAAWKSFSFPRYFSSLSPLLTFGFYRILRTILILCTWFKLSYSTEIFQKFLSSFIEKISHIHLRNFFIVNIILCKMNMNRKQKCNSQYVFYSNDNEYSSGIKAESEVFYIPLFISYFVRSLLIFSCLTFTLWLFHCVFSSAKFQNLGYKRL